MVFDGLTMGKTQRQKEGEMEEGKIVRSAAIIENDPYAKHLGIEFTLIEEGHAKSRMELKPEHKNFMGMIHGGAIFSLADATFGAAANSYGKRAMAIHVSIDYLQAPGDTPYLEADVRETARAGRVRHYFMEVRNILGEAVAVCHGWAYHTDRDV